MAAGVRDQTAQTRRLAEAAERQLETSTMPVIRVMRMTEHPGQADMVTVNAGMEDERLCVRIENRGAAAAEIQACTMMPGGAGRLATDSGLESPVLDPRGEWDIDFDPTPADKAQHEGGHEVHVEIVYEAIASGKRFGRRTAVRRNLEAEHETWVILREDPPMPL